MILDGLLPRGPSDRNRGTHFCGSVKVPRRLCEGMLTISVYTP